MSASGLPAPARRRRAPMAMITAGSVLVGVAVAVAAIALGSSGRTTAGQAARFIGPAMPPGFRTANFSLPDQNGRTATLASYRGRVVVLTFLHSLCHGQCPIIAQQIRGGIDELPAAARARVSALAVSVDPRQDTPANVRHFLAVQHLTGRLRYLRGNRAQLAPVWRSYAVQPVLPTDRVDAHSALVLLIDRTGRARVGYTISELTPDDLAHDLRILVRE